MSMAPEPRFALYTIEKTADMLHVSASLVRKLITMGELKPITLHRKSSRLYITCQDLESYIERRRKQGV